MSHNLYNNTVEPFFIHIIPFISTWWGPDLDLNTLQMQQSHWGILEIENISLILMFFKETGAFAYILPANA